MNISKCAPYRFEDYSLLDDFPDDPYSTYLCVDNPDYMLQGNYYSNVSFSISIYIMPCD